MKSNACPDPDGRQWLIEWICHPHLGISFLGVFSSGQLLIMFPKQILLFLPYEPESTALELHLVSGPVWEGESGMRKEKAGECFMRF